MGTGTCDRPFHGRYGSNTAGIHASREAPFTYAHQRHGRQVAVCANQLGSNQVCLAGHSPVTSCMAPCVYLSSAHAPIMPKYMQSRPSQILHCLLPTACWLPVKSQDFDSLGKKVRRVCVKQLDLISQIYPRHQ